MIATPADVLGAVTEEVRALHDPADRDRLTFEHWVPRSERKQRQRLFVASVLDGAPRYVAKVALDPEDAMVGREWRILRALHEGATTVPSPVAALERGFAMASVGSRDLPDALRDADPATWRRLLVRGAEIGARVHLSDERAVGDTTAPPTAPLESGHDLPGETVEALARARVGAVHGDMGPWNFRVADDGALSLIDWEDYAPRGICALDVLNLLLTASLVAYPEYRERGFDWLFGRLYDGDDPYHDAVRAALSRYEEVTGEAPATVLALTPVFCGAMIRRIRAQGRPVDHLFFGPLAAYFADRPLRRLGGARV